jgi:peptidyl-prolyl cis-trans isomerase D
MLQSMRKSAKSWAAVVLFGLLIISFAIWGIGDMFRPGVGDTETVATAGGSDITAAEYRRELRAAIDRFRDQRGVSITFEQARGMLVGIKNGRGVTLADQVLDGMIEDRLIAKAAAEAGIIVNTATASAAIRKDAAFHNRFGRFDRQLFLARLRSAGLSEQGYVTLRRRQMARTLLTSSIVANTAMPKSLIDKFYAYANEKRVAEVLFVPEAKAGKIPEPTEKQLTAFYKKNERLYTVPELRVVTAVILRPSDVLDEVGVTDEELKQSYEARKAEFTTPEKRTIEQILLTDEAAAKKVYAALKDGDSFEKAAKEVAGQKDGPLELGTLAKKDIVLKPLAEAAFSLKDGEYSAPFRSDLGWHIIRVSKIIPGAVKSFDAVKEQLRTAIRKERAPDVVANIATKLEDAIGLRMSLEEAAKKIGAKVTTFPALSRQGKDADGKAVKNLPADPEFLSEAFDLKKGQDSGLVEGKNNLWFVVRVDTITPPRTRPLAEVKARVTTAWQAEQRRAAILKHAKTLEDKAKAGQTLQKIAKDEGLSARTTGAFTREGAGAGKDVPSGLIEKLFAAKVGATVSAATKGGVTLATLKEIKSAKAADDTKGVKAVRSALVNGMNLDLNEAYMADIRRRYGVEINRKTFEGIFAAAQ